MCGLFASISEKDINLNQVLTSLERRGPDGHGHLQKEVSILNNERKLNLVHTRLSIVDPGPSSNQPFHSEDSRYSLIFNGEIYNYIELRNELEKAGHSFITKSDTEVLLKAYIEWGQESLKKLRGIFAFCIWDHRENLLFIARDHLGIKPLYLGHYDQTLVLSSTIDTILASELLPKPKLNDEALIHFTQYGSYDGKNSLIEQIKMFPAGHFAIIKNDHLKVDSYWEMEVPTTPAKISYQDALVEINRLMLEVTELQMRADVDVGAFLSGGIDSGMLVALMSRYTDKPLQTYSIGFDDRSDLLEWELANKTSEKFKTNHHEIKIDEKNFGESLDEFFKAIDHPTVDGLNSFLVSRETGKDLKVAISGLGGDEAFAGYYFFPQIYRSSKTNPFLKGLGSLLPYQISKKGKLPFLTYPTHNLDYVLNNHRKIKPHSEEFIAHDKMNFCDDLLLSSTSIHELNYYTQNTLLRDIDAVSMHNSLEVRVPFLDHKLIEFLLTLPDEYKISDKYNKPLLIDSFPDELPKEVITAPKKGFEMPIGIWISRALSGQLDKLPRECEAIGINPEIVKSSINLFKQNPNHYIPVWRFIVLTSWLKTNGLNL